MIKRTLTFIDTPGHGYLSVSHKDLIALKLVNVITTYSYMVGNRVYLEEDCDATAFLDAAKNNGWLVTLKTSYNETTNFRNYPSYNKSVIGKEIKISSKLDIGNYNELFVVTNKTSKTITVQGLHSYKLYDIPQSSKYAYITNVLN